MYVPICNRFHIIRANNGKIDVFLGGTLIWRFRSCTVWHEILSR